MSNNAPGALFRTACFTSPNTEWRYNPAIDALFVPVHFDVVQHEWSHRRTLTRGRAETITRLITEVSGATHTYLKWIIDFTAEYGVRLKGRRITELRPLGGEREARRYIEKFVENIAVGEAQLGRIMLEVGPYLELDALTHGIFWGAVRGTLEPESTETRELIEAAEKLYQQLREPGDPASLELRPLEETHREALQKRGIPTTDGLYPVQVSFQEWPGMRASVEAMISVLMAPLERFPEEWQKPRLYTRFLTNMRQAQAIHHGFLGDASDVDPGLRDFDDDPFAIIMPESRATVALESESAWTTQCFTDLNPLFQVPTQTAISLGIRSLPQNWAYELFMLETVRQAVLAGEQVVCPFRDYPARVGDHVYSCDADCTLRDYLVKMQKQWADLVDDSSVCPMGE